MKLQVMATFMFQGPISFFGCAGSLPTHPKKEIPFLGDQSVRLRTQRRKELRFLNLDNKSDSPKCETQTSIHSK